MDFEIIKRLVVAKLLKEQSEKKLEDEPDEDSTEDSGEEMAPEQPEDTGEKEKEEYPPKDAKNVIDVSGEAGFCDYQPKITDYALSSPENMTEVLIFCIASQQVDWINIYTRFPHLINWLYNHNGMFPKDAKVVDDRLIGGFPSEFSPIVMGMKAKNIDTAWKDRDNTYYLIAPIMRRYLRASGEKRREIAFELYIQLLDYVHLGIPKAGFAMQLLIGSYACVDSINKLTLEIPMPEELFTVTSKGEIVFKSYGKKSIPGSAFGTSSLNLKMYLGGLYRKFTEEVGELANDNESKVFWEGWVKIVSAKVNYRGEKIHLVDPRKPRIYKNMSIKSDYKKYSQGVPSTFPKGMQTPRDITRQHASVMRGLRNITEAQMFDLIKKAVKQKLMESSTMAGGSVEGGMTKSPFINVKRTKKRNTLKESSLYEVTLNEQQLNELLSLNDIKNLISKYSTLVSVQVINFMVTNIQKILDAIKEFLRVRTIILSKKQPTQAEERKKLIRDFINHYGKYAILIVGAALFVIFAKSGNRPPAFVLNMVSGKMDINAAVAAIENSLTSLAATDADSLSNITVDAFTENKKLRIKRKLSEKMNPATDRKNIAGNGMGGTHYFEEEELDEDVIVEYLTEAEAKKKNPPLGKVTRNPSGSKKKFHVYVRCGGKVKKISFGDPNLSIKRDSPERRKSFRARHKCDKPEGKNRCTARYWSCYQWRAGAKVKSEE